MQKAVDTEQGRGFNITINGRAVRSLPGAAEPKGQTMPELAASLDNFTQGVPVTDKTGLEGIYKINLAFSTQVPGGNAGSNDPDLLSALQQQLGLKLEERKGLVDTFILDHIERPTSN
jgi:uncharacterized protein (TIGR03435 family)